MALRVAWLVVDSADPATLARWWMEALDDYEIEYDSATDPEADPGDPEVVIKGSSGHRMLFGKVPEAKTIKNRLHLDLRPEDRDAEVARLEGLGAKRVDIGQGDDKSWVVLADIEGNEFCVLRALDPEEKAAGVA
ncbi:MAG: VOC family protein [Actinobacteria bacterium]|nr:VOC family protein [Actinomycetota bacterium]